MKQLLQNTRTGELRLEEVPDPALQPGGVVARNHYSLVSAGTERASFDFARQSLIGKARSRPDLVKQVLNKVRTDGLLATYRRAQERLNALVPLGYSSAARVLEVGSNVAEVSVGDLVACGGAGYASHAEVVFVPKNLVVKLPESVSARQGTFATLGAIALQGIHRAELSPGERVAVIGLGLVGQLTVQLLHAYGFPVLGLDVNSRRVADAVGRGMELGGVIGHDDPEAMGWGFSKGLGVDAVIITAATETSEPVELAGRLLRERGRVSVVGDVGLDVPRRLYYERELDLRVSRSYGPGRYDPSYEEKGIDYPIAYARWTERRNMEEFLRLVALGRVDVEGITTHTFPIDRAQDAYRLIIDNPDDESFLGVLLEYGGADGPPQRRTILRPTHDTTRDKATVGVGVIGGGTFARETILPTLWKINGARVRGVASATGRSAADLAKRNGCDYATTDYQELLADEAIDLIVVSTRHNLHASIAIEALDAGKHVHVEKPLALDVDSLRLVASAASRAPGFLTVGFNRRFARLAIEAKDHFSGRTTPLTAQCRVNAGFVSPGHWVHDPVEGGGRILGEVCHFVDLLQFLVGAVPQSVFATRLPPSGEQVLSDDNVLAVLDFAEGSRGSILYSALGADSMPKELLEVLGDGRSSVLDNFRTLHLYRGTHRSIRKSRMDKGHEALLRAVVGSAASGEAQPVPLDEILLSSMATLAILQSINEAAPVKVDIGTLLEDSGDGRGVEGVGP